MKYWFYSEGNILGPYAPGELLTLPAFAQDSLVCFETSAGDKPGDWKPASQVGEIAEALSVGTGKLISSEYGGVGDLYALETGFSQAAKPAYENASEQGYSYENLLNTIDGILRTGDSGPAGAPERESSFNYDLMDKFDIRLSKIQEELEAARWEKNLLLEKMRMKDLEDKKQRDHIADLESRLKAALGQGGVLEKESEQPRQSFGGGKIASAVSPQQLGKGVPEASGSQNGHLEYPEEKTETVKKIEEIKKENLDEPQRSTEPEAPVVYSAGPKNTIEEKDSRILKNLKASGEVKLEKIGDSDNAAQAGNPITSGRLKSLRVSAKSLAGFEDVSGETLSGSGSLPGNEGADNQAGGGVPRLEPPPAASEPKPDGVVYDFTAVTPKSAEPFKKVQFNIETQDHDGTPAGGRRTSPEPGSPSGGQPSATEAPAFQFQGDSQPHTASPGIPSFQSAWQAQAASQNQAQRAPETAPITQPPPVPSPDKTERIVLSENALKAEVEPQVKTAGKGGRLAFIAVFMILGAIAAGGLGFFFLGDGLSLSEFLMLDFNSSKHAKKSVMPSQLEPQVKDVNAGQSPVPQNGQPSAENEAKSASGSAPEGSRNPAAVSAQAAENTAAPLAANEGVKAAIETVKNYKLSGGRGAIGGWFANSFLSGSSGGASEEWSATPLHGDILVVQYRVIRQKQDPLVYQFEVDGAKNDIIRGINNNAIELLDFSSGQNEVSSPKSEVPAKKIPAKKLSAKANRTEFSSQRPLAYKTAKPARKPGRSAGFPILPLPDAPGAGLKNETPTGFEDAQPENGEKVKYIRAQESDEELF